MNNSCCNDRKPNSTCPSPKAAVAITIQIATLIASVLLTQASDFSEGIRHDPENFKRMYNYWRPTCSYGDNNAVPSRTDGFNCNDQPPIRKWSLTSDDMQAFVGNGGRGSSSFRGPLQLCKTVDELVNSAAQPVSQAKCLASWFSAESICRIQEKYSAIIWHGDSLVRHMVNAMFALLTENLRFGGYPLRDNVGNFDKLSHQCGCDGQFSESSVCRTYDQKRLSYQTVHEIGACAHLPDLKPTPFFYDVHMLKEDANDKVGMGYIPQEHLCNTDGRPVFIFMSGGSHFHFDPHLAISKYVDPLIHQIRNTSCVFNHTSTPTTDGHAATNSRSTSHSTSSSSSITTSISKVQRYNTASYKLVFLGVPVVNASVVKKYPHQSPEAALHFNTVVKAHLHRTAPEVTVLDFWNLTKGAVSRTSDGFHSLMDVNIMKVMTLINVMNLLTES